MAKARTVVDRRPDRVYVGPCNGAGFTVRKADAPDQGCGFELFAKADAANVACQRCGTVYDVALRRQWMLEASEDYLLTLTEMTRALPGITGGLSVKESTLKTWRSREQLVAKGKRIVGDRVVETYRVGDVIELATRSATRKRRPA